MSASQACSATEQCCCQGLVTFLTFNLSLGRTYGTTSVPTPHPLNTPTTSAGYLEKYKGCSRALHLPLETFGIIARGLQRT